ncbi:hypothetical protein ACLB2K_052500 [Fragaria x ananassa]
MFIINKIHLQYTCVHDQQPTLSISCTLSKQFTTLNKKIGEEEETNLVALTVVVGWRIGARRQRSGGGSDWVEEVSVLVGWGGGGGSDVVALTVVVGWRIGARRQRSGGDRV